MSVRAGGGAGAGAGGESPSTDDTGDHLPEGGGEVEAQIGIVLLKLAAKVCSIRRGLGKLDDELGQVLVGNAEMGFELLGDLGGEEKPGGRGVDGPAARGRKGERKNHGWGNWKGIEL